MISFVLRISLVVGVGIFGAIEAGIFGAFAALMLLGISLRIWYMATGIVGGVISAVKTPRVQIDNKTLNLTVEEGAIKGQSVNADPTRPTTDDFMGIIEQRKHRD